VHAASLPRKAVVYELVVRPIVETNFWPGQGGEPRSAVHMRIESMEDKDMSIAECEICSKLTDFEYSFDKHGWEEQPRRMPVEAAQLEPAEDIALRGKENDHVKRCPICGTFYRYVYTSEYLVNGSEDSEELTRLTPAEARGFLSDEAYDRVMAAMTGRPNDPSAQARHYAGRSLVSHDVERGEYHQVPAYLTYPDADVARGAIWTSWQA